MPAPKDPNRKYYDKSRDHSQESETTQAPVTWGKLQSLVVDLRYRYEDNQQVNPGQSKEAEHEQLRTVQMHTPQHQPSSERAVCPGSFCVLTSLYGREGKSLLGLLRALF